MFGLVRLARGPDLSVVVPRGSSRPCWQRSLNALQRRGAGHRRGWGRGPCRRSRRRRAARARREASRRTARRDRQGARRVGEACPGPTGDRVGRRRRALDVRSRWPGKPVSAKRREAHRTRPRENPRASARRDLSADQERSARAPGRRRPAGRGCPLPVREDRQAPPCAPPGSDRSGW